MLIGRSDLTTTSWHIVINYTITYHLIVVLYASGIMSGTSFMQTFVYKNVFSITITYVFMNMCTSLIHI